MPSSSICSNSSSKSLSLKDNILDLSKRFDRQIWVYGNNAVKNKLEEIRKEVPDIMIVSYDKVTEYLVKRDQILPQDIPKRTGVPSVSHIGKLHEPIPLHKLSVKKTVHERLGEAFFAIPSSVHEFIIIPESSGMTMPALNAILPFC